MFSAAKNIFQTLSGNFLPETLVVGMGKRLVGQQGMGWVANFHSEPTLAVCSKKE